MCDLSVSLNSDGSDDAESSASQERWRQEQIRLQANGAAVLFIFGGLLCSGLSFFGASSETVMVAMALTSALFSAGVLGLSPGC
jgi:hypothetical protein